MRPPIGWVVKCGKHYATGALTWAPRQRRGFLFTDAVAHVGASRSGLKWAREHMALLLKHPWAMTKVQGKLRVVPIVRRS